MQVVGKSQGISVKKPEGTDVTYYIFPEYEIHYNEVAAGTIQPWHHHNQIEETLYIISGKIEAHWIENGAKKNKTLHTGDVVRVENTPHTFINNSSSVVAFVVFRLVLEGKDKHEVIKNDKHLDDVP
ncbi:MAG: cupin domain-containing protein [Bdellovibrionales bacterium]|jgi:quercetin dioxygenase-like cupin family protein